MRNLFIVAAKIIGLFQFCDAFQNLSHFPIWRHWYWREALAALFEERHVSSLLLLALAYVLVFKTAWLADKVGLGEKENSEPPALNRDDLLAVGLKLAGLYFAITFISFTALFLALAMMGVEKGGSAFALTGVSVFSLAVMAILAILFLFRTRSMVAMLTLAENAPWRKVVFATLAALLVLFGITVFFTMNSMKRMRNVFQNYPTMPCP